MKPSHVTTDGVAGGASNDEQAPSLTPAPQQATATVPSNRTGVHSAETTSSDPLTQCQTLSPSKTHTKTPSSETGHGAAGATSTDAQEPASKPSRHRKPATTPSTETALAATDAQASGAASLASLQLLQPPRTMRTSRETARDEGGEISTDVHTPASPPSPLRMPAMIPSRQTGPDAVVAPVIEMQAAAWTC